MLFVRIQTQEGASGAEARLGGRRV